MKLLSKEMGFWSSRRLRRDDAARKHAAELSYWRDRLETEGDLSSGHYQHFYTDFFGLRADFYDDKRVLDVGCGPRGSLDWAVGATQRVGLDPLGDDYVALRGGQPPGTHLVTARAEDIPFPTGHFDVVSSFNSFDHVDDPHAAALEMSRVAGPDATLLLIVDINQPATATEPHVFTWDVLDYFSAGWRIVERRDYERADTTVLGSLLAGVAFDHARGSDRPGVLAARLERPAVAARQ